MPLVKGNTKAVVRIELPADGEWVEVKEKLGNDDERAIRARMLTGQRVIPGEPVREIDAGAYYDFAVFATMEVAVVRWSFKEPVSPSNIRALDQASIDCIAERLDELYPAPLTEEQGKN